MPQFAYACLTRSQRVSHENLRLRDKDWLEGIEKWFASRAYGREITEPIPPMFTPFSLRDMTLTNRVVVSPMSMYSAVEGMPTDWHFVHYGSLATGGAALLYTEMTDVSPEGRITPGCPGIWNDEQRDAWKRIVDYVHAHTGAKIAMQIGHSGPKGATKEPWKWDPEILDEPLDEQDRWPILAPSALPYDSYSPVPKAMDRDDMDLVRQQHVDAVKRADAAGFDMLELHAAHGYLMSSFITPVQNKRKDEYGGSLENRLRYPLEVFGAMREAWPAAKPMSVRISAHDWMDGDSVTPDEAVQIARAFSDAGADIIDVSSGQTSHESEPIFGRMFQTPLSDKIRNEAHVATMAVGNIYEVDHVNSILAAGRADLCCLARPHLADPRWTLRAAAQYEYRGEAVVEPNQYFHGYRQLELNLKRAAEMAINA